VLAFTAVLVQARRTRRSSRSRASRSTRGSHGSADPRHAAARS